FVRIDSMTGLRVLQRIAAFAPSDANADGPRFIAPVASDRPFGRLLDGGFLWRLFLRRRGLFRQKAGDIIVRRLVLSDRELETANVSQKEGPKGVCLRKECVVGIPFSNPIAVVLQFEAAISLIHLFGCNLAVNPEKEAALFDAA